eukprot:gb/GECG01008152.1/.p1 GENE.gb/GECG01008152.1/~~gb/GECG01008152.1/.p1  ORF type:complete len:268 (+),score=34.31 gb/GECG01008152.1/:1-804(+)
MASTQAQDNNAEREQIYVLELENNKKYVGKTARNPLDRFSEHSAGKGCAWTRRYAPLRILSVQASTHAFDEDTKLKETMMHYGMNNVRGGSYSNFRLDENQKKSIQRELASAGNLCFQCMGDDHVAADCSDRGNKRRRLLNSEDDSDDSGVHVSYQRPHSDESDDDEIQIPYARGEPEDTRSTRFPNERPIRDEVSDKRSTSNGSTEDESARACSSGECDDADDSARSCSSGECDDADGSGMSCTSGGSDNAGDSGMSCMDGGSVDS